MADSQLKDAHKQIQDLKAELYSVRKSQREAQQQRDALGARVQDLQHHLQEAQQQSWQVPGLEKALAEASANMQALKQEVQSLRGTLLRHIDDAKLHQTLTSFKKAAYSQGYLRLRHAYLPRQRCLLCVAADGLSTVSLDLENERSKRARAREAKERADADRLRLQRARDELAKNIMVRTFHPTL